MRKMTNENNSKKRTIIGLIIGLILVTIIGIVTFIFSQLFDEDNNSTTNLVINNKNVTANLKNEIIIKDNVVYLSKQDISNFFDKYIYEESKNKTIITTYNNKVASIGFNSDTITVNGETKKINAHAITEKNTIYLPISEMTEVYGVEIKNIENSKVITIDSIDKEQKTGRVISNLNVKSSIKFISKTVDKIKKDSKVIVVSNLENGWTRIRTEKGKLGYIKTNQIDNITTVREAKVENKQIEGKVSIVWDYFSEYYKAPDRTNTKIDGVNVVSPAFFRLDSKGVIQANIGNEGEKYIKWAHQNNYKVWPMVSNAGDGMLKVTSDIMNDYDKRQNLIDQIVKMCKNYKIDGINIDFENMKKEDKDLYSRFIIELTPRIKDLGLVVSVDVTAPDGGDTWSLCFDRNVIGNVADYIVFMAYDEYGASSIKAGPTAGYDWVELSLNKFLKTEEIKSNKIILAVPFYTRLWSEDSNMNVTSRVIYMKNINSTLPSNVQKQWNEKTKQNYVEYKEGKMTKKMWIEDINSIKEKLQLIKNNELAGVAAWAKDMEGIKNRIRY